MANYKKLVPKILLWEGGFACIPGDSGGATNRGVTIGTFRYYYGQKMTVEDLKKMTEDQWMYIFKKGFWDKCLGDQIISQSVAEMLIDWAWMSGVTTPVKHIQKLVGVTVDGKLGPMTLAAINAADPYTLWTKLHDDRDAYYYRIVQRDPVKKKFLRGWRNRLAYYKFES